MALNAPKPTHAAIQYANAFTTLAQIAADRARKRQITDWYEAGEITASRAQFLIMAFGLEEA